MSLDRIKIAGFCQQRLSGSEYWDYLNLSDSHREIFEMGVGLTSDVHRERGNIRGMCPRYLSSSDFWRYLNFAAPELFLFEAGTHLGFQVEDEEDGDDGYPVFSEVDYEFAINNRDHSGPGLMAVKHLIPKEWGFKNNHHDYIEWQRLNKRAAKDPSAGYPKSLIG